MSVGYLRKRRPARPVDPEFGPEPLPVAATTALPTGRIKSPHPISGAPFNLDWATITRWYPAIQAAVAAYPRVLDDWLAAIITIESNGVHYVDDDPTRGPVRRPNGPGQFSVGLTQITLPLWKGEDKRADGETPAGNVMLAAAFIEHRLDKNGGDIAKVLLSDYFPRDDANGTTQAGYLRSFRALVNEWAGASDVPVPPPVVTDPMRAIVGNAAFDDSYGWLDDAGLDFYAYGVGHGTTKSTQHPAIDLAMPVGTPLYAPAAGVVRCVGGAGSPDWGQGCGAYPDTGGGTGNITILLDGTVDGEPRKLTLGHCRSAAVKPGDRVTAGQLVGTTGNYNGEHVHVEVSTLRNGTYWLLEPRSALRPLLTGAAPPGPAYKAWTIPGLRVPILLPADIPVTLKLTPVGPNRSQRPLRLAGIVSHETANPNMGAAGHAQWQYDGTPGHPDGRIGVHAYVDEFGIWITIPFDEQGVHSGDGRNETCLGFERCVNDHGKADVRARSERHQQELQAAVLRALGMTAAQHLSPHTTSACPAQTNAVGGWPAWVRAVDAKRTALTGPAGKQFPDLAIPDSVVLALFPAADPSGKGIVTKAWIAAQKRDKRWYPFTDKTVDGAATYWLFGTLLLRSENGTVTEVTP